MRYVFYGNIVNPYKGSNIFKKIYAGKVTNFFLITIMYNEAHDMYPDRIGYTAANDLLRQVKVSFQTLFYLTFIISCVIIHYVNFHLQL